MSPHSYINRPPVVYKARAPWWIRLPRRAAPWVVLAVLALSLVSGTTLLIAKLHATQAQLDQAHLAGMALGMSICGGSTP
jgi:hypothetical protein